MAAGRCTGLPGRGHPLRRRALDDLLLAGGPAHRDAIAATAAEGIATRVPVPRALRLMDGRVDAMILVAEGRLDAARRQLTGALGVTVEHSAAAAWLGLLDDRDPRPGASVLLITGSNVAAP